MFIRYITSKPTFTSFINLSFFLLSSLSGNTLAECEEEVTPIPGAPTLQLAINNQKVDASWSMGTGEVEEYILYYAPDSNPISDITLDNIQFIDMGNKQTISTELPAGTELYVAVTGANCSGESAYSNIEVLRISNTDPNSTPTNPTSIDPDEPAAVSAMRDKASNVIKNDQGYYEAIFSNGMSFIYIPGGTYTMGANNLTEAESPTHQVKLNPYWIAKYQVTKGNFSTYVTATGFITDAEKADADGCYVYDQEEKGFVPNPLGNWKNTLFTQADNHPVVCVSHNDATAYAKWLSTQLGVNIKLPTEAQWEMAARGTDQRSYPWGNTLPNGTLANYADINFSNSYPDSSQGIPDLSVNDGYAATAPVGSYPAGASPFGALDMAGNASEWVADWFTDYSSTAQIDPTGPDNGNSRVNRGGNWVDSAGRHGQTPNEISDSHNILSAGRAADEPNSSDDHNGFRVSIQ